MPSPEERRGTFRLLSYWNRMRGEHEFASLADIDVAVIPELWHFTFTIDLTEGVPEAHFQNFGPELCEVFGTSYAGELVLEAIAHDPKLENTMGFYPDVITRRVPIADSSQFELDGMEVRYRSLIVPLSSNRKDIDYLMGTTNYKAFPKSNG